VNPHNLNLVPTAVAAAIDTGRPELLVALRDAALRGTFAPDRTTVAGLVGVIADQVEAIGRLQRQLAEARTLATELTKIGKGLLLAADALGNLR